MQFFTLRSMLETGRDILVTSASAAIAVPNLNWLSISEPIADPFCGFVLLLKRISLKSFCPA